MLYSFSFHILSFLLSDVLRIMRFCWCKHHNQLLIPFLEKFGRCHCWLIALIFSNCRLSALVTFVCIAGWSFSCFDRPRSGLVFSASAACTCLTCSRVKSLARLIAFSTSFVIVFQWILPWWVILIPFLFGWFSNYFVGLGRKNWSCCRLHQIQKSHCLWNRLQWFAASALNTHCKILKAPVETLS